MEKRKLTKEDIDKVRDIEGFPIGSDEDIIALSDAPYYTACPNPFIKEFIEENGTSYDEETDDYHREPYAADVSEGKYDPMYKLHPYHTKVPHQAIANYIEHYTKSGDLILDGYCGTGMTGVAAQIAGKNPVTDARNAILIDLSSAATFISAICNDVVSHSIDVQHFMNIINNCNEELGWMYKTKCSQKNLLGDTYGEITSVFWSDIYICPHCGQEFVFWNEAVDYERGKIKKKFSCPLCNSNVTKSECAHAKEITFDSVLNMTREFSKQVPVQINYTYGGKRYSKKPDQEDYDLLKKVNNYQMKTWFPTDELSDGFNTEQPKASHGFSRVYDFYFRRSLIYFSYAWSQCMNNEERGIITKTLFRMTKRYAVTYMSGRWGAGGGPTPGTLFIPALSKELNIGRQLEAAAKAFAKITPLDTRGNVLISTQSSTDMKQIPSESIDYIFTDPPFGGNINYSELNSFWESWLKVKTNIKEESIVNETQHKDIRKYLGLIQKTFFEYYRVLKPNRWITVEFHNSLNVIWNAIQTAITQAGFVVADVRILSKGKESFKQIVSSGAVKEDLVISAYKPLNSTKEKILSGAGTEETTWAFVTQHLSNLPVVIDANHNGKIDIIPERQAYLLFDRMVAYHIMNGIPVPIDATDFYKGLDEKFLKRDGMYFLPDQVNEYDTARIKMDVEPIQFDLFVTNEKSAIAWLYRQLDTPQTYAELQPKFMQEVKSVDRYEDMPELSVMLDENFIQDDKGRWYIPDRTKEGDVAKLREKNLWKEFESYMNSKGKLKLFRSEAIRVGFSRLWKDKNYQAIVDMAERLPGKTIQEDDKLLMYYDISLNRLH
ncbi:DNA methyltransferase [Mitsuokella multacida]|uniref:DNA methyltransferase n=1 Tax=Mitsuokella multacida TaxID=52226 RepID=UPI003FEFFD6A